MRNPRRRRNISLVLVALGLGYLIAFGVQRLGPEHEVLFGVAIASFFTLLLGTVGAVAYQVTDSRLQRLLRGERVLARWTVSPAEWQQFLENERKRASSGKHNTIKVSTERAARGVEVVVTEESLLVDDDFHHLIAHMRILRWLPETPAALDLTMVTSGTRGIVTWHVRFPVAAGTETAVRALWDYHQQRLAPRDQSRLIPRYRAARSISVGIALISVGALVFARLNFHHTAMRSGMLTALVGGMLGLPLGVFIGLICHWWLTRGPGKPTVV